MSIFSSLFSLSINKPLKRKDSFHSCSLLDSLSNLLNIFPQNFEISTNNGKYFFNKDLTCIMIPIIGEAINNDKELNQFHLNIDDNLNIMKKIESLFKGESVDFFKSEEKEVQKIIKLFIDQFFTITFNNPNDDLFTQFPDKMSIKINLELLYKLLGQKLPKSFRIKTKKKEYLQNCLGIMNSKAIMSYLSTNPNSTEFNFNFSDENLEFQFISDYFNFKEIKITSENIEFLQSISEQLEITPIIELINKIYDSYDESLQKSTENQKIIEPYDELFERLFNIKQTGPDEVIEFILKSVWVSSESDVQELVACLMHVVNTDIFVHKEIVELVTSLSEKQDKIKELTILIPFLTKKVLQNLNGSKIIASFLYHLYSKNHISIDLIIKKISFQFAANKQFLIRENNDYFIPNNRNILSLLIWFYPELLERNLLDEQLQTVLQKYLPNNSAEQLKELRDNYVEKDSIILALKKDDVDTFQSIISIGGIDINSKKIDMSFFDNFNGGISFIDYAAACGSVKCFKYLLLNDASLNFNTFANSIYGANVEIIRILDQHRNDFPQSPDFHQYYYEPSFMHSNSMIDVVKASIKHHKYNIFDWLLDQNTFESDKDLIVLFKYSITCGNAHSMIEIIRKLSNLNNLEDKEIYLLIEEACSHGFYIILKFLSHLIKIHDLVDPTKGDHSDLKDISNRRIKIQNLNSSLLKSSMNYGIFSIFELIFNEGGISNSQCLFEGLIEAIQSNNLNLVKFILENKIYELSGAFLIKAIQESIEFNAEDVMNYLFKQNKIIVTTEILEAACSSQNFELVKRLIQKATEEQISIDFTEPFIKAANPFSDEICRYFIENKFSLNYQMIFGLLNNIIEINPRIVILIIENVDEEIKDDIINQALSAAILSKESELLDYLFKKDINLNGLLFQAIRESDSNTVKTILKYNHSPEFINQIGPKGTALHLAVYYFKNDLVELLLECPGIDPSLSVDSIRTPLVEAVDLNNLGSVKLILKFYGDSIKDQGYQIHNAFKQLFSKQSIRINDDDDNGIIKPPNFRYVFGANDHDHQSPETKRMIFELLLDVKKKLNPINMIDLDNDFLSYAINEEDENLVQKILTTETKTNLKRRLKNGDSYLHLSIKGSVLNSIHELLINHPYIDINSQNVLGETPLIRAVKNDNIELVDLILSNPKFDPKLSLLNRAFFYSVPFKNLSRNLLNANSLDVNDHCLDKGVEVTPLMEAISCNDIQLADLIIKHPSFDPSKSKIKACLFNSVHSKNLDLFRFLLKMNRNEINAKDDKNVSLLGCAASINDNEEILNEILNNDKFDPIKSDIQASFLISNNQKAIKLLFSYDEKHGNHLSFDKIDLLIRSNCDFFRKNQGVSQAPIKSYHFLLRKKGIVPRIQPFCTSIISNQSSLTQVLYSCQTCQINGICEICAKICHKNHKLQKMINISSPKSRCKCSSKGHKCKCISVKNNNEVDDEFDEIYDDFTEDKNKINECDDDSDNEIIGRRIHYDDYNNNFLDEHNENFMNNSSDEFRFGLISNNNKNNAKEFDSLRCSLDLARYQPILQIMYRCQTCEIDICQNCSIRCHKGHSLEYIGMAPDSLCNCKSIVDCKCTDRKTVICSYSFYGTEYFDQPWFKCNTCGTSGDRGCCAVCSKKCHKGHNIYYGGEENAFCDCGANDLKSVCKCMKLPPFNYLTCCTNRNQNYLIQQQRMYHCFTCGITSQTQGICESCAIHCHVGHKVVFFGIGSFACECATMKNSSRKIMCIASLCPEMYDTGKCVRLHKNIDAVFGKYVCFTCDKEGKKSFCESCVVNCHKNHDVHFVEFSNFECQCEPCQCMNNK